MRVNWVKSSLLLLAAVGLGVSAGITATATSRSDHTYYRANQTFRIQLYGSSQRVTIPRGTVVKGQVSEPLPGLTDPAKTRLEASFDLLTVNYQLKVKNGWPKKVHAGGVGEYTALNNVGRYLTMTTRPKYMLEAKGESPAFTPSVKTSTWTGPWITVTTDGYLESFGTVKQSRQRTEYRPQASAKITKFTQKGTHRYYYTQKAIKGIPTKRVATHGKYQYRLTVTDTKKTKLQTPKNQSYPDHYHVYKFGKQTYYTFAGNAES
ncbi:hypothetical protein [Levilactobacillus acidifarinae]|uniref:Surface layer protein A domain-containing protein n=1 Tax=Levilactobacillus acidifarinae DSM 19394 = JCM 15949 TaxID=1423715 RepID=A0A0R1LIA6_9LACO|nr:hypothetical protein [Levilactobacillus acidifarinae]KRK95660.1 hypothetical protein FD25_GL000075 [Levilactobacillus acidifarinae DSM 19394]GEO69396.1 hypothetical protein LAC03_13060 [Levilactobacillus acidifarinae]